MKPMGTWLIGALLCLVLVGCGRGRSFISTQYGESGGLAGRNSVNGFGALRKTYEHAGYDTRDVYRLTDRVTRSKVVVWTPQVPLPIAPDVTRWFDQWLRRGSRTLVYIVPDSGSETEYWLDASRLAPPQQRLEYRRRAARSLNQRMQWTVNRAAIPSNGWFRVEPSSRKSQPGNMAGPWQPTAAANPAARDLLTEYRVTAFQPNAPAGTSTTGLPSGPTGPAAPSYYYLNETNPTRLKVNFESLLDSETGETIVAKITSKQWRDSKVIVVAGGSLLTNYAFTKPYGVQIATSLVSNSAAPNTGATLGTAGFLTSGVSPIPISERNPEIPQASGMELLTTWPISLVTIHAALLGFVICMMMLPLFGRPRTVDRGTTSNFGDHLDAVAALLIRTGGERFARARISEYMRRMHGETQGKWVLPEEVDTFAAARPLSLDRHHVSQSPPSAETVSAETAPATPGDSARAMGQDDPSLRSTSRWRTGSSENPVPPPTESTNDDEAVN